MPDDMEGGFSMDRAMQAGASTNAYLGRKKAEDVANSLAQQTQVTYDSKTDLATVQLPSWALTKYMSDALKFQEIEGIYNKQIAEKEARIEQMKSHPFINTLSQIAASMAANDPNPYTRGIGQAAQRLNPTVSQLEAEKLGATKELSGIVERERQQDLSLLEHEERLEEMRTTHQERAKEFGLRAKEIEARDRETALHHRELEAEAKARLEETKLRHKELQRDFDLRLRELKQRKSESDTTKIQNTIMRGRTELERIDRDIANLEQKLQAARDKLETGSAFDTDQQKTARLRNFGEAQKKIRTQIAQMEQARQAIEDQIIRLDTKGEGKYKPGDDPAGLGIRLK